MRELEVEIAKAIIDYIDVKKIPTEHAIAFRLIDLKMAQQAKEDGFMVITPTVRH